MAQPLICIVEDEPAQIEVLSYNLEREGYRVVVATSGEAAMERVYESVPDLIVLDWMLPDISGIEVCRTLREQSSTQNVPIIMLTARGEELDRVRGLTTGADDYVVKPYSPAEMVARVGALLRRSRPALSEEKIERGDIVMDLAQHKVLRGGQPVHLGPKEYHLLQTLMERPGRVLSRTQLLDAVWGRNIYVEDRTIDVHIRRLRKALIISGTSDPIRTVRGAGYAFDIEN